MAGLVLREGKRANTRRRHFELREEAGVRGGGGRGREMAAIDMFRELMRSLRKWGIGYLYSKVVL